MKTAFLIDALARTLSVALFVFVSGAARPSGAVGLKVMPILETATTSPAKI